MGTIPTYPAISTPTGGEQLAIWQSGQRQATLSALLAFAQSGAYASVGAGLAATFPGQTFSVEDATGTISFCANAAGSVEFLYSFPSAAAVLAAAGAGLVGFSPTEAYPAGTVGAALLQGEISPIVMGAKADAWQFVDGVIESGNLSRITSTNTGWKASAVSVGNPICILGAGPAGAPLVTTIAGVTGGTITLASPASQAVSGAIGDFGTDDTAIVQAAINLASATGRRIDFGGPENVYYIAGASAQYPSGFNRGSLILPSNVTMVANRAMLLLSGGRNKPGGMFYNDFWSTPGTPMRNICFDGLIIDCNIACQTWPALPANFGDGDVWQWGHAVCLVNITGFEARNCLVRNARGDGFNLTSYLDPSNVYHVSRGLLITRCEFVNIFGNGVAVEAIGAWVTQNYFHGDGYWVAGVNIETNAAGGVGELQAVHVEDNVFDFRDGLSPVERTPAFATDSADALAARIHLRRFVAGGGYSPGFPGGAWTGTLQSVFVQNNTVWQGVMDLASFGAGAVTNNTIVNTNEVITGNAHLIHYPAIEVVSGQGSGLTGLEQFIVEGNNITSALPGAAVYVYDFAAVRTANNIIKGTQAAGIRYADSSGQIIGNQITDCGGNTDDPSDYFGIAVYGGQTQPLDIALNQVVDTRGTPVLTGIAYLNVAGSPVTSAMFNVAQGFSGLIDDVNGFAVQVGNRAASDPSFNISLPTTIAGSLGVAGAVRFGDTTGNNDANVTLNLGPSGTAKTFYTDNAGLEYQDVFSGGGGRVWQRFSDGTYQWTDLAFGPTGECLLNLTWQKPLLAGGNTYLWICQTSPNAGQCRKKIGSAPTSDTDGVTGWGS